MSSLLQRLAAQAIGVPANSAPRIRPAMSVHAQVPVSLPQDNEGAQAGPTLVHEAQRLRAQERQTASPAQLDSLGQFTPVIRSVEAAGEPTPLANLARPHESHAIPAPASRQPPHRQASHDFIEQAPQLLPEEAEIASFPPVIAPAVQPSLAATVAPSDSRVEPTEVHVHIGRIEVIAAPEPALPKKNRSTATRNTLPLADYLARRRRS